MQKRYRIACGVAAAALPMLAVLRAIALPRVVAGITGGVLNTVLLLLTAAVLAALLILCSGKQETARLITGRTVKTVVAGMLFTGIAMLVSSLSVLNAWNTEGVLPYPSKAVVTQTDTVLLYALVALGCAGGAFFVLAAWQWFKKGSTDRGFLRVLALAPVAWIWVRIARFEISYVSSMSVYRGVYDLLMLVFEMLFFLWFARFVSGVEEGMPRFLIGSSLCVGVLAAAACVTRVVMVLARNEAAFESCGLVNAADLGVAVLALSFAFGQVFCSQPQPQEEAVPARNEEEEDGFADAREVQHLLEAEMPRDDEDDFDEPNEPRRPLELEDLINDIVLRHQQEKDG